MGSRLSHVPGEKGLPVIGHALEIVRNPYLWEERMRQSYGDVFRYNALFEDRINLTGVEAVEKVLIDQERIFSAERGYRPLFADLAPPGLKALPLMDFDEHRWYRRAIANAFSGRAMRGYFDQLQTVIPATVRSWGTKDAPLVYPLVKELSQEMAATAFLGLDGQYDRAAVDEALSNYMNAQISLIRRAWPGTAMRKGLNGLYYIADILKQEIPMRRGKDLKDVFSLLCNARDDDGNYLSDDEIASFGLISWTAAHDSLSSTVTALVYELCQHPEIMARVRDEITGVSDRAEDLVYDDLAKLPLTEGCIKETLRLYTPLYHTPRVAIKDTEFQGTHIPEGTTVTVGVASMHRDPRYWDDPEEFRPERFIEDAAGQTQARHPRLAWAPFGGGAHSCIGLAFGMMQIKLIISALLTNFDVERNGRGDAQFVYLPLIRPKDKLPVRLTPRVAH
ncbi:MAG: cytochrome P450 [Novosphingobium sp.]